MIIIGIDPGLNNTGFGLIEIKKDKIIAIDYGSITNKVNDSFSYKIKHIHSVIDGLIKKYSPHELVLEEIFFSKNTRSAINVGKICGAVALTATLADINVFLYTPLEVKQAVVGYGRATKNQVQLMVRVLLNLSDVPRPDHAADALAVAICHIHSRYSY
ncbi:MAG: Crossover junction endodeoxyribonuclease RuvC [candidate division TA06 bacterium 34_109]|uniref:Crossover junction endodeoxyribonuclease RuvC n=1 Tax=candidate division TA06 bacterium 34_109 TaxID=1635277 RepID=A0A101HYL0_UNCT6|nr:MAG: Crossover junction endodeoxyribonuclease RuvC [candidate division TA06 bacterium 34_109]